MKKNITPLVDEHIESLKGINEYVKDDFFYTRLKARMQNKNTDAGWSFPLQPVWVLATMVLLLVINVFMLSQKNTELSKTIVDRNGTTTIKSFAEAYDQTISTF